MMHQSIGKKIFFYLFLFFLLSTTKNFNTIISSNINKIDITSKNFDEKFIQSLSHTFNKIISNNIFSLNKIEIKKIFQENPLVDSYEVFKVYPSKIKIDLYKTKFLAKTNIDGENYIIGSNGRLIKNFLYTNEMPTVFGNPPIKEFLKFVDALNKSNLRFEDITRLFYFKSGRWDIETKYRITFKLPKENLREVFDYIFFISSKKEFNNIEVFDFRIKKQFIIND